MKREREKQKPVPLPLSRAGIETADQRMKARERNGQSKGDETEA